MTFHQYLSNAIQDDAQRAGPVRGTACSLRRGKPACRAARARFPAFQRSAGPGS